MSGTPLVSIIIVNYNGLRHLDTCLEAVAAQEDASFEAIVVDNGSHDGSAAHVRRRYPWARLIELGENAGFARGNNLGAAEARGRLLAFLNNDTRAEPGWLAALCGALRGPDVALATSRIVYMHDPSIIDSAGDVPMPERLGYEHRRP